MNQEAENLHWTDRVIAFWRSEGLSLQPGVSKTYIAEVEAVLGFTFPPEFVELYSKMNGFEQPHWTSNMFVLWPLEQVYKEHLEQDDDDFIAFCDYLINSHTIGFCISDSGIYKNYDMRLTGKVSNSFRECIELINADSELVY